MPDTLTVDTVIDLWRDNRLDQPWSLTVAEIAERYVAFRPTSENLNGPFMRDVAWFIGAKDGLSSVTGHDDDLPEFMVALADTLWPIVKSLRADA